MRRDQELNNRLLEFAVRVIALVRAFPKNAVVAHVGGQLLRSGTSPGANYEEACGAESCRDFCHKLGIVLKELKETRYWLRVSHGVPLIKNPSQIEEILCQIQGVGEGWQIVIHQHKDALDTLLIELEAEPAYWKKNEEVERIREDIAAHIQARLGISAIIEVKEPFSLPRFEGKSKRVLDRRKDKGS